jgi:hypothetical protein
LFLAYFDVLLDLDPVSAAAMQLAFIMRRIKLLRLGAKPGCAAAKLPRAQGPAQ